MQQEHAKEITNINELLHSLLNARQQELNEKAA
jgi:hypothetical protein